MKKIVYSVICWMAVLSSAACSDAGDRPGEMSGGAGDRVILNVAPDGATSRAVADGAETAVDHLDVLVFTEDGDKVVNERVTGSDDAGRILLSRKRSSFGVGERYWVWLVANSTAGKETFDDLTSLNGLKSLQQEDLNIHMTGIDNVPDMPQTFLMDGVAYAGESEPAAPAAVVLNDGDSSADTELKATLKRAAAKIVVKIRKGDKVEFSNAPEASGAGYFLRNMPYTTSVVSGVNAEAALRTPGRNAASYFNWSSEVITVTAYAYSHAWENQSALEQETRLIVNVPLRVRDEQGAWGDLLPSNYYQIPVSRDKSLLRNHYYSVTVTLNAAGAVEPSEALEIKDVEYSVQAWTEQFISVGGKTERPIYLTVNTDSMKMYNTVQDTTTLRFASSSEVHVKIVRAYFIDKFGQEQEVDERTLSQIKAEVPEGDLTGIISVYSPVPENNAVRYIELEVNNTDDAPTRRVVVAQYPLEYITNIQSWYSYRSDFGGTTYEKINGQPVSNPYDAEHRLNGDDDRIVAVGGWDNRQGIWREYQDKGGSSSTYFFTSKVAEQITYGNNKGKSNIYYYDWEETRRRIGGSIFNPVYEYSYDINKEDLYVDGGWGSSGPGNARMYHVRITASSGDYTVGRPRMTEDGITDPGADNAVMVSPSFMIASQLGATYSPTQESAASHCKEYVEVYKDPETGQDIHLSDWRLPTKAEIEVIIRFQYVPNAAMDEVLAGPEYWSANGIVNNPNASSSGDSAIRCIRDAYEGE